MLWAALAWKVPMLMAASTWPRLPAIRAPNLRSNLASGQKGDGGLTAAGPCPGSHTGWVAPTLQQDIGVLHKDKTPSCQGPRQGQGRYPAWRREGLAGEEVVQEGRGHTGAWNVGGGAASPVES